MANHRVFNSLIRAGNGVRSELSAADTSWSLCPGQVPIVGSLLQSRLWECINLDLMQEFELILGDA